MSDKLSFMDGGSNPADPSTTPAPMDAAPAMPEPQPSPQAPAAAPAPVVEAPQALQATPQIPPGYIPIAAQLDEREKRRAAEERAAQIEARLQQIEAQNQKAPDLFEDPEGFRQRLDQEYESKRWIDRANMSELIAVQTFGADLVREATEAFKREVMPGSPRALELQQQVHPVGYVVDWYKQQQVLKTIGGTDLDAFVKRRAAELGFFVPGQQAANPQQLAAQQPLPQPNIPASIAAAPSAGGVTSPVSNGPGVAFEAVFKR